MALVFGITTLVYFFALRKTRSFLTGLPDIRVDPAHPENRQVLQYLHGIAPETGSPLQLNVTAATDIKQEARTLLTHARFDEVEGLWSEALDFLPEDCRCVVYGRPALAHPQSGALFAVLVGRSTAFRGRGTVDPSEDPRSEEDIEADKWVESLGGTWATFIPMAIRTPEWWKGVYDDAGSC